MILKFADESARVPPSRCPHCRKKNDRAGHVSKDGSYAKPTPGALSVCIGCGGWSVYKRNLKLRKVNARDLQTIDAETHSILMTTTKAIKEVRK